MRNNINIFIFWRKIMKKLTHRFMAILLAMVMLFGMIPVYAVQAAINEHTSNDGFIETVTADYNWYIANPDVPIFIISTEAEFIGFMNILNNTEPKISYFDFSERIVRLGNDINLINDVVFADVKNFN